MVSGVKSSAVSVMQKRWQRHRAAAVLSVHGPRPSVPGPDGSAARPLARRDAVPLPEAAGEVRRVCEPPPPGRPGDRPVAYAVAAQVAPGRLEPLLDDPLLELEAGCGEGLVELAHRDV